jgi:hypothetical protein
VVQVRVVATRIDVQLPQRIRVESGVGLEL